MGSRAKAYQKKISELGDPSAVEKVTHWFELAKQEGYDVR
jgi:hypothetical protein